MGFRDERPRFDPGDSPGIVHSASSHPRGFAAQFRSLNPGQRITGIVSMVLAILAMLFAPNGALSATAIVTLASVVIVCWREGEPAGWLFVGIYLWLQAATLVFLSDIRGEALLDQGYGQELVEASYLSLIGILSMCAGARVALCRSPIVNRASVIREINGFSPKRLFVCWVVMFLVAIPGGAVAFALPGLTQPLLTLLQLRWVAVFLLTLSVASTQKHGFLLAVVILAEAVYGAMGYFGSFKNVFVVAGIAAAFAFQGKTRRVFFVAVKFIPLLLVLAIYWTSIKEDYRTFVNQGTGAQVVLVSPAEQFVEMGRLVAAQSRADLSDATEKLLERLAYVEYFARTIGYVPAAVPFQEGRLWLGAIRHVLSPRLLDPEKPELDDSAQTTEFTGTRVAGVSEGTSIGLGFVAQSYIDFGPVFMFLPLVVWGALAGAGYRVLYRSGSPGLGAACATILIIFNLNLIETSNAKMLGGFIVTLLVFALFLAVLGPRLQRFLMGNRFP